MIQRVRLMLGLICSLLACHAAAQRPVLQIATGELAPYATTLRPDNGIALSVVQEAFQIQDVDVRYTFLPWSRAQMGWHRLLGQKTGARNRFFNQ